MTKSAILITGANGEIGHGLIEHLQEFCDYQILALDLHELDSTLKPHCQEFIKGDILDTDLFDELDKKYEITTIYHLASLLSTKGEQEPLLAHNVNVNGTLNLLKMADQQGERRGCPTKFIYPSSIAAYGIASIEEKFLAGRISENMYLQATTMYGINKLYCEHLGRYFMNYYGQMSHNGPRGNVDFRALRFPGLISPITLPTGGTTDYGPEMLHHAAQKLSYKCFVRPDTRLPFMVMPDAIKSLIMLEAATKTNLSQVVYNVTSFSPTARDLVDIVMRYFPDAQITFEVDQRRQRFVDTWPMDIDDTAAREDWGWEPDYNQDQAFNDLLIPAIKERYGLH